MELPAWIGVSVVALLAVARGVPYLVDHVRERRGRARRLALLARLEAALGHPRVPLTQVPFPGTPSVRVEEGPGDTWVFLARWPDGVRLRPYRDGDAQWAAIPLRMHRDCGTVTAAGLAAAKEARAVFSVDGLRVQWSDPEVDPVDAVAQLRRAWEAIAAPSVEALADSVRAGPLHLRGANLRAIAERDPALATELAARIDAKYGPSAHVAALALRGDTAKLKAIAMGGLGFVEALEALARTQDEPDPFVAVAEAWRTNEHAALQFAELLVARPRPSRWAFVAELALTGRLRSWPAQAAGRLATRLAAQPDVGEEILVALVGTAATERALARLTKEGTVAVVPRLRSLITDGTLAPTAGEPVVRSIQHRASGERGGLALAEAAGGALSETSAARGLVSPAREGT